MINFCCTTVIQLYTSILLFFSTPSWPTLCNPKDGSTPASLSFTISWSLLKLIVQWVDHAIQPSHTLSSPSPPTLNLSQHQSLGWLVWSPCSPRDKSLLQYHSSKASILWRSAFFIVQLSHSYMTTGKTIALTGWTFVGKVIALLLICYLCWS